MRSFWDFIQMMLGTKAKKDVLDHYDDFEPITRKQQVLAELMKGRGSARQLSLRMGVKLTIIRGTLTALRKEGLIRDTGKDVGLGHASENVWEIVAMPTWEMRDERGPLDADTVKRIRGL